MKNVIITRKNGNVSNGAIHGEDKIIINNINYLNIINSSSEDKQIIKVNIIKTESDTGFVGRKKRDVEYNFCYDKKVKCYLY